MVQPIAFLLLFLLAFLSIIHGNYQGVKDLTFQMAVSKTQSVKKSSRGGFFNAGNQSIYAQELLITETTS